MTVAVLPGSFDPITKGHMEIIVRAAGLFDRLIVGVFAQPRKNVMFSLEERLAMIRESLAGVDNVEVLPFEGLLVNFARDLNATVIVRGLRWVSDFEYEFQQAAANRKMSSGLETVCIFASTDYVYFSSSIIKEIAENAGDVRSMVPPPVQRHLAERFPPRLSPSTSREVTSSTS